MGLPTIVVQLIGASGYFFLANSYFNKEKGKLLIVQIVANFLLSLHYFLLAGIGGAICNIVCIFADISLVTDSKNIIRIIGLVAAICWLIYGIIFSSYAGIVFEIIIITSTIASYIREKIKSKEERN